MNKYLYRYKETNMFEKVKTNYLLALIIIICIINIFVITYAIDPKTVDIVVYTSLSVISSICILIGLKNTLKKKVV
jgi:hypothetical protein